MSVLTTILIIIAVILGIVAIVFMVAALQNYRESEDDPTNAEAANLYWQIGVLSLASSFVLMIVVITPILLINHPFIKQ